MSVPAPYLKTEDLKDTYIFLDNDFLGSIFSDVELLHGSLELVGEQLVISTFTRIEFLRDVYLPEIRKKKESFLESKVFLPMADHQIVFEKTRENALLLSRLYAHNKKVGASLVDLLLAGTLMMYEKAVLVTGNKKDFPSFLFDTVGVMNFEQVDGGMRAISVVKFNPDKFRACESAYEKLSAGKKEAVP